MILTRRKKRLYFTMPDVENTRKAVEELLLARIESRHIHVMANDTTTVRDLPEANSMQKTDVVHGMEVGVISGGTAGVLAALVTLFVGPAALENVAAEGGLVLALGLIGAGFGFWFSGMTGSDIPNTQLKRFKKDLEAGRILLMVDVHEDWIPQIRELIKKHHIEAKDGGLEPEIPVFP